MRLLIGGELFYETLDLVQCTFWMRHPSWYGSPSDFYRSGTLRRDQFVTEFPQ